MTEDLLKFLQVILIGICCVSGCNYCLLCYYIHNGYQDIMLYEYTQGFVQHPSLINKISSGSIQYYSQSVSDFETVTQFSFR